MRLKINDEWRVLPSSLSEITLRQRIEYQQLHGDELELMYKSIMEMPDDEERELELVEFQVIKMIRSLSYFLDITQEALKETEFIDTLTDAYFASVHQLFVEEQEIIENPRYEFIWNEEVWVLHTPELKNGDKMSFGEFIESKQIIQDMVKLGKNRWECMLPLCTIYLRRKGEEYDEKFMHDDSERLKLMEELPMDIALHVGFFLTNSLNSYQQIFLFSLNPEQSPLVTT